VPGRLLGEPVVDLALDDIENPGAGADETREVLDSGREATLITGTDPRIAQSADHFETLLESALSAAESALSSRVAAKRRTPAERRDVGWLIGRVSTPP
jgi:hypothetical protein